MVRTTSIDKNGMKKGTWSEEEDNKLRAYVQRYGHWNWRQLPKFAGVARCGKSCRLRWMNYLRPGLKRGKYTKEEEDLIMELHQKLGNKYGLAMSVTYRRGKICSISIKEVLIRWSAIAARLPGRSDNEIKNYWHTNLKKRMKKIPTMTESIELPIEVCWQSEAPNQEMHLPEISQIGAADRNVTPEVTGRQNSENKEPSTAKSCSELPCLNSNWVTEDVISSWELFPEAESFWREPFLLDTYYNQNEHLSSFEDGGFFTSYSSYLDDNIDFLYRWMEGHA